jgi:hypothetical protein
MFSERWICFCCPQATKPRRSIVPIEQIQPRISSRTLAHKKSDVSKVFFLFLLRRNIIINNSFHSFSCCRYHSVMV